jgi:hypothetical protein
VQQQQKQKPDSRTVEGISAIRQEQWRLLPVTVCEHLVLHATENKMQIAVADYDTVTPIRRLCNAYKLWHFTS